MTINAKIIALDLRKASIENLENWLISSDLITADSTKNYIRHCITTWKGFDEPIQILFIINDFLFGYVNDAKLSTITIDDDFQEELINFVIPIKLSEVDAYRPAIIEWIFNSDKTKAKIAMELRAFQKYSVADNIMNSPHLTTCVTAIDVEELGFTLKEFFVPMNSKFKAIIEEFKKYYAAESYLKSVKLTRIFIIDKYILGYSFRMDNEPYDHFFWNIHIEEQLLMLDRFTFDDNMIITLDDVLDKINSKGIENLSDHDRNILNNS